MIIDLLSNANLYYNQGTRFKKAFEYLAQTDFSKVEKGKYELDGTNLFAIFFPHDLHVPNIMIDNASYVKKVVIKVAVEW